MFWEDVKLVKDSEGVEHSNTKKGKKNNGDQQTGPLRSLGPVYMSPVNREAR